MSVVRMKSGRKCDKARIRLRDPGRVPRLIDRGANADYSRRTGIAGADYYFVAVAVEGFVREMGVAVDEAFHADAGLVRGYLCSIQRSTGPAM